MNGVFYCVYALCLRKKSWRRLLVAKGGALCAPPFATSSLVSYTTFIMVITYHGGQCFKITFGGMVLTYNPISKKSKLDPVKFGTDVALVSLWHPDFNGVDQVTHGAKKPFVIDGPGEYEVGEVMVSAFGVETIYEKKTYQNTIYKVLMEGMNLVFLGSLASPEIDPKIMSNLGNIDILFLPIGGGDVLEVPQASKLAVKLEAKLVIPMQYDAVALDTFLKEESKEGLKAEDKVTLKPKAVSEMSGDVVVLKA